MIPKFDTGDPLREQMRKNQEDLNVNTARAERIKAAIKDIFGQNVQVSLSNTGGTTVSVAYKDLSFDFLDKDEKAIAIAYGCSRCGYTNLYAVTKADDLHRFQSNHKEIRAKCVKC